MLEQGDIAMIILLLSVCVVSLIVFWTVIRNSVTRRNKVIDDILRSYRESDGYTSTFTTVYSRCPDYEEFLEEFHEWADRCPLEMDDTSRLLHLREEVNELIEKPDDVLEMADIGLILLKHCYAKKVDLLEIMQIKYNQIKDSSWHPPDANGVVRRVK